MAETADERELLFWVKLMSKDDVTDTVKKLAEAVKGAQEAITATYTVEGTKREAVTTTTEHNITNNIITNIHKRAAEEVNETDKFLEQLARKKKARETEAEQIKQQLEIVRQMFKFHEQDMSNPDVDKDKTEKLMQADEKREKELMSALGEEQDKEEEVRAKHREEYKKKFVDGLGHMTQAVGQLGRAMVLLSFADSAEKEKVLDLAAAWESGVQMAEGVRKGIEGIKMAHDALKFEKGAEHAMNMAALSSGAKQSVREGGLAGIIGNITGLMNPMGLAIGAVTVGLGALAYISHKTSEIQQKAIEDFQKQREFSEKQRELQASLFADEMSDAKELHSLNMQLISASEGRNAVMNKAGQSEAVDEKGRGMTTGRQYRPEEIDQGMHRDALQRAKEENEQYRQEQLGKKNDLSSRIEENTTGSAPWEEFAEAAKGALDAEKEKLGIIKELSALEVSAAKEKLAYEQKGLAAAESYSESIVSKYNNIDKQAEEMQAKFGKMDPAKQRMTLDLIKKLREAEGDPNKKVDFTPDMESAVQSLGDAHLNDLLRRQSVLKGKSGPNAAEIDKVIAQSKSDAVGGGSYEGKRETELDQAGEQEKEARAAVEAARKELLETQRANTSAIRAQMDEVKKLTLVMKMINATLRDSKMVQGMQKPSGPFTKVWGSSIWEAMDVGDVAAATRDKARLTLEAKAVQNNAQRRAATGP